MNIAALKEEKSKGGLNNIIIYKLIFVLNPTEQRHTNEWLRIKMVHFEIETVSLFFLFLSHSSNHKTTEICYGKQCSIRIPLGRKFH